ncbi:Aldo/keto reductase [Hyphopichia burtonii NRRL Y-1933]|uniref:Aldo/keto reductase n=1 Tax=Hyphopichia burtonii NRRL Y-1933 TaxID=984485 RepID=A0A1E4RF06_9ASCO|nr:Aldo/keto reductase [Hyphopichia burtonii NRRL Y-1933]ODV65847.1 Aldo/keto reductase [Hyphopichia burtonii NRRL Y-1933]
MSFKPVELHDKLSYGTMTLTATPESKPIEANVETVQYVVNKYDVTFVNWGEFYDQTPDGPANLVLMKKFLESNDDETNRKLVFSIKGGYKLAVHKPQGSKEGITASIKNILSYLPQDRSKRPKILFEAARRDFEVPYDKTIEYIADFVKSGDIDGISLSEVGTESIRKAVSVYPISAVELELSLTCQDLIYNGVLEELAKQQIPIVAYSPIGRGILTDYTVENSESFLDSLHENDFRRHFGKFQPENYKHNLQVVKKLYDFAHNKKNTSLESLALSWILKLSELPEFEGIKNLPKIIPIPGGSTIERIDKNFGNIVELSDADLAEIQSITKGFEVKGVRYTEQAEHLLFA